MYFLFSKAGKLKTSMVRVPYNKLLTNLASSSSSGEYWPSVVFERTLLRSVRTATTSGQYSPVRPSRSVSKRLIFVNFYCQCLNFVVICNSRSTSGLDCLFQTYLSIKVCKYVCNSPHHRPQQQQGKYFKCI